MHLGPGEHFGLVGVLVSPAEVLGRETGWLHIQVGPGETGWVKEGQVTPHPSPLRTVIDIHSKPATKTSDFYIHFAICFFMKR
jgi:hypothetical protein